MRVLQMRGMRVRVRRVSNVGMLVRVAAMLIRMLVRVLVGVLVRMLVWVRMRRMLLVPYARAVAAYVADATRWLVVMPRRPPLDWRRCDRHVTFTR